MVLVRLSLAVGLIGMARPSTPAGGNAEASIGSLIAAGPSVLEKPSGLESPVVQAAEKAQEQSQADGQKLDLGEESGRISLKISGPIEKGAPKDLVSKLADSIRDETKEKKE